MSSSGWVSASCGVVTLRAMSGTGAGWATASHGHGLRVIWSERSASLVTMMRTPSVVVGGNVSQAARPHERPMGGDDGNGRWPAHPRGRGDYHARGNMIMSGHGHILEGGHRLGHGRCAGLPVGGRSSA